MSENPEKSEESDILDLRVEYAGLMSWYTSVSSMYWTGYTAFFAVNTLLATGLAFAYSQSGSGDPSFFVQSARVILPVIGMVIAIIAVHATRLILKHQNMIADRGAEIDRRLATNSFTILLPTRNKYPLATTIGAALFFIVWALAAGTMK